MSNFHLLRPEFLFLLIPIILISLIVKRRNNLSGKWKNIIAPQLQAYVLKKQTHNNTKQWELPAITIAALFGVLALTGPSWEEQSSSVYNSRSGLVIALDLSLSMNAQDVTPTRLQRAKFKISDILKQDKERYTALIAFAGTALTVTPLTRDSKTISAMVPSLDPFIVPKQGSNYIDMAQKTIKLFEQSKSKPRQLLIITDGIETQDIVEASTLLKQANIDVSILAIGTDQGGPVIKPDGQFLKGGNGQIIMPPLEWKNLTDFSNQNGARIHKLNSTNADIDYLLLQKTFENKYEKTQEQAQFDQWIDEGYWLLIPLLLLALAGFRRGVLLSSLLCIALSPQPSWAFKLPTFLLNDDQQALSNFDNKPKQASTLFKDKKWKASSLYKAGDYQGALDLWSEYEDADSLYNKGNALMHLNKFDEAAEAYERALIKNPELEDAKANLQISKALQEQMKEQKKQSEGNESQDTQNDTQPGSDQDSKPDNQTEQPNADSQSQNSASNQDGSEQNGASDGNNSDTASENPVNTAQTDEEKAQEEKINALKEEQGKTGTEDSKESTFDQEENIDKDGDKPSLAKGMTTKEQETQQAMDQLKNSIPDDPGGLLRNKFLYQYKNRPQDSSAKERKPW